MLNNLTNYLALASSIPTLHKLESVPETKDSRRSIRFDLFDNEARGIGGASISSGTGKGDQVIKRI
jgi:hypothetical protein